MPFGIDQCDRELAGGPPGGPSLVGRQHAHRRHSPVEPDLASERRALGRLGLAQADRQAEHRVAVEERTEPRHQPLGLGIGGAQVDVERAGIGR